MSYIYIASPYSHPDAKVREQRFLYASYYFLHLLEKKKFPYSPIVANHRLAQEWQLKTKAIDWMAYNFAMLSSAKELHVLRLAGWEESVGVLAEVNFWRATRDNPALYIDLDPAKYERKLGKLRCLAPVQRGG